MKTYAEAEDYVFSRAASEKEQMIYNYLQNKFKALQDQYEALLNRYGALLKTENKNSDDYYQEWSQLREEVKSLRNDNRKKIVELDRENARDYAVSDLQEKLLEFSKNDIDRWVVIDRLRTTSSLENFMMGLNLPLDDDGRREIDKSFKRAKHRDDNLIEKGEPTNEEREQVEQLKKDNAIIKKMLDDLESDIATSDCEQCLQKIGK